MHPLPGPAGVLIRPDPEGSGEPMTAAAEFQRLIDRDEILLAPGAYDAASAKLAAQAGADVVYMSGSSVSTTTHGYPDVGLTTLTEMTTRARQMATCVDIPVFCDADTGYGNPVNVHRTVEEYEAAGAAGIHLEDQTFPKRCGHFENKTVIPQAEMTQKIRAATDARSDPDFVIIARTDARAVHGYDAAIDRANAYADAGADVIFFEAPISRDELANAPEHIDAPVLANMAEGGKTPLVPASDLEDMGYAIVIYPATGFKAMLKALQTVYTELLTTGTPEGILDQLVTWEERNQITGLADITQLEQAYASPEPASD